MSPKKEMAIEPQEVLEEKTEGIEEDVKPVLDVESTKKQKEDLLLYLGEGFSFVSVKGEEINVPPLMGIKEKQAILYLLSFLGENEGIMEKIFADPGNITVSKFISIFLSGGNEAWDAITGITASLLDKEISWVGEHLMLPDMLKVVRPFFLVEGKQLIQTFKK